jgi:hypothetical protein
MAASFLLLSSLAVASAGYAPSTCSAASSPTACGPGQTCCPTFESLTGWGCCNMPGAVCCPAGPENQNCCPAGHTCVPSGYGATCVPPGGGANVSGTHVCTPGAALPPSASSLPSVITIGDSVSEGYQPVLTARLAATAFVQHSPHSDGGGADNVANGVACEENFLRTASYQAAPWTLITFNFGLHDLYNTSANYAAYEAALSNFTARLKQTSSKLLYVATTPQMAQQWYGNEAVLQLNAIASRVTAAAGIPFADLYSHVTKRCGAMYTNCSICDDESSQYPPGAPPGSHCGYHYTAEGYEYLVDFLAPIVANLLAA